MKILRRDILHQFVKKHADVENQVANWLSETEEASWSTPNDVKKRYPSASFLKDRVVIFNIKGNHYRLEVQIAYNSQIASILWIGTHAEYDKRNKER
jgi:mRNA interferase HigB